MNNNRKITTNVSPLEETLNEMTLPRQTLTEEQRASILALAMQKVDWTQNKTKQTTATVTEFARPKRTGHTAKRAGSFLVAAAVVAALSITTLAVGTVLLKMSDAKIGFFEKAPSQSAVSSPLDAPRGDYPVTQPAIEAYNVEVGQLVTSNDVSITLDNISMDSATLNAFFTITGDQAVKGMLNTDNYMPEWSQLAFYAPSFGDVTVNGQEIAHSDCSDFYRIDDNTLKLWLHYQLSAVPQGETVTVQLTESRQALGVNGEWSFTVQLDGASVRAGGKAVQPGTYFEDEQKPLELTTLTFGPVGGTIGAHLKDTQSVGEDGTEYFYAERLSIAELLITDDTGKTLFATRASTGGTGGGENGYDRLYNLTTPEATAASLTLTPVHYEAAPVEQRSITTGEMQNGVKIETSPIGGYTVQNFRIEGSAITWEMVPYGWNGGVRTELIPSDDDVISYATEDNVMELDEAGNPQTTTALKSALSSNTFDPQTGIYTERLDYYAATAQELAQIQSWSYAYNPGYSLDTARAVTLPLESVE